MNTATLRTAQPVNAWKTAYRKGLRPQVNIAKEKQFLTLVLKAHEAGLKAAALHTPIPMVVSQHANMADDNSPVTKQWYVPSGVCGFAWVVIKPATSAFARWAKDNIPYAGKHYYGGLSISDPLPTQSMTTKEAYCHAYANVLNEAGVRCYSQSRMD